MAGKIRVLRVIEYTYDSAERYARDQRGWTIQHTSSDMSMQSAVVSIDFTDEAEMPLINPLRPTRPAFDAADDDMEVGP